MQSTQQLAHVYIVENSLGLIKIGIANNPAKRFKAISANSGLPITRHHESPLCLNYQSVEKALLAQFKAFRVEGEWLNGIDYATVCSALDSYFSNLPATVDSQPNTPVVFNFGEYQLRTFKDDKCEIWFCLKDACDVLDIKDFRTERLDQAGVIQNQVSYDSGTKSLNFVNEPNLYRVIFRSDKPQAKAFQDWVFSEVLPSIRKTGSYGTVNHDLVNQVYQLQRQVTAIQEALAVKQDKPKQVKQGQNPEYTNSLSKYVPDILRYMQGKERVTMPELLDALGLEHTWTNRYRLGMVLKLNAGLTKKCCRIKKTSNRYLTAKIYSLGEV
jgi:prophage antirepressor-like protein